MFQWYFALFSVVFSFVAKSVFTDRHRALMMYVSLMYLYSATVIGVGMGGVLHFALTSMRFMSAAILCNGFTHSGFKKNPVWGSFVLFYVYMFVSSMFGLYPGEATSQYLISFMFSFGSGYYLCMWVQNGDGRLRGVCMAVLIMAAITALFYIQHGGLDMAALAEHGRATLSYDEFDRSGRVNENMLALCVAIFFPFLVLVLTKKECLPKMPCLRLAAMGITLVLALILIRTGSRNGALAILPCVWFFIASTRNVRIKYRRIGMAVVLGVVVAGAALYMMRDIQVIRAFSYSDAGAYGDKWDNISSGRISMYQRWFDLMTPEQVAFGAGYVLRNQEMFSNADDWQKRVGQSNYHSMYMTVFYRTGVVGSILFLFFVIRAIWIGLRSGERGKMGLLFFGVWLLTGIGESWGLNGGATGILAGFGIALMTRNTVLNYEMLNEREKVIMYNRRGAY